MLSIYDKKFTFGKAQELKLDQRMHFTAFHGYLEPEYFDYKPNGICYLGIGNMIFKNWKLRFLKGRMNLHGLEMEIETHLKASRLHGNSNFKIQIAVESSVIHENSLEDLEESQENIEKFIQ